MSNKEMFPIKDPKDIPEGMTDEERATFWESHELTEEFLAKTEEVPEEERPQPRAGTRPISIRVDTRTLDRLKKLAEIRGVGYQTLLKDFVTERLYEEEKREGILPAAPHVVAATKMTADWLKGDTTSYIPLNIYR